MKLLLFVYKILQIEVWKVWGIFCRKKIKSLIIITIFSGPLILNGPAPFGQQA